MQSDSKHSHENLFQLIDLCANFQCMSMDKSLHTWLLGYHIRILAYSLGYHHWNFWQLSRPNGQMWQLTNHWYYASIASGLTICDYQHISKQSLLHGFFKSLLCRCWHVCVCMPPRPSIPSDAICMIG